ncbi:MAG: hypothetical protein ACKOE2_02910, partial [Actinomycetales bacterium]
MANDRDFVVIGAGGLGHEVLSTWLSAGNSRQRFLGFIDSVEPNRRRLQDLGANWLGADAQLHELQTGTEVSVAVGSEATRRSLTSVVIEAGLTLISVIDPTVTLGSNVTVGAGSI